MYLIAVFFIILVFERRERAKHVLLGRRKHLGIWCASIETYSIYRTKRQQVVLAVQ